VLVEFQTNGRGRGSNRWWSSDGALTFSLVLDARQADIPLERRPQVSLTAGLGVCEALAEMLPGQSLGLKWPNDVFLGTRKVCGILVEVPPRRPDRLVVGVGINVNNSFRDAPVTLRPTGTSLADEAGEPFDVVEVLLRVLSRMNEALELLADDGPRLAEAWRRRCLLRGRTVHLEGVSRKTIGLCRGIASDGALLIETPQGLERAHSGVIAHFD
jgi:BirA family biotin operon repressor/biotin-[acetyl-CoA-carboxylase] ligase